MIDQRITREYEVGIGQMYFLAEQRLLGVRHVLPANGSEGVQRIFDNTAGVVIRDASRTVIVQAVRCHDGRVAIPKSMDEANISTHARELGVSVVVQPVAEPLQGIPLLDPHMTEGVERVRRLIEIGAVAEHECIIMAETHIPFQYLGISDTLLVKTQGLRALQIDHCLQ